MEIPANVRVLNFFRNVFRIPFIESILAKQTQGKSPQHLVCKLVPNPYQYPRGSFRVANKSGIILKIDISDYIGHYLYFGFSDEGIDRLFSLCHERSNVIDVGTNVGWTALNFAKIAYNGNVIGFEPDPFNFNRCIENIGLNSFKNIKVHPIGLGDQNGMVNMEIRTPSNRGGNRVAPAKSVDTMKIDIVRLDDFAPFRLLNKIDLIKIDVEGYELKALRGAVILLQKHKPALFIEVDDNNLRDQGDSALALIDFLLGLGYREISHAETGAQIARSTNFQNCHFDIIVKQ